jgi:hypothetical protein
MCSKEQHQDRQADVQIGACYPAEGCAIAGQSPAGQLMGTRPNLNKQFKEVLPLEFPQDVLEILVDSNWIL